MDAAVSRRMWTLYEPVHAMTYFAPEVGTAWSAVGVDGFWRGYFAGRAAPLGPVPAALVDAAFFGFDPGFVDRAVPAVWDLIAPEAALEVRVAGAVAALDAALGPDVTEEEVAAADLLRCAAGGLVCDGRVLAAANAVLPWPEPGAVRATLWHAATVLREHRGDGHVAAMVAAGVDGLGANVLAVADGPQSPERVQQIRGWSPESWADGLAALVDRGLVAADGAINEAGRTLRADVEVATDVASLAPWRTLGDAAVSELDAALGAVVDRLLAAGVVPYPNAIGVPRPA